MSLMRLIDAERLMYSLRGNVLIDVVPELEETIAQQPTAFDKEKVIEELDKLTGEECTLHECGIRSERCKPCIAKKAIEIVEKGGIE